MKDTYIYKPPLRFLRVHTEEAFAALRPFVSSLPSLFAHAGNGRLIYKGRNELREFDTLAGHVVVKEFCVPHLANRLAYGVLRASKAQRSCEYAALLREKGIGSPAPVGWCTTRNGPLLSKSYYVSLRSGLPYTYIDLIHRAVPNPERYLRAVGRVAGRLHEAGMIHRDFSRGNILLGEDGTGNVLVELVDLNRLRFHKVGLAEGVRNFERLPADEAMRRALAEGYALARGVSAEECLRLWPRTESMDSQAAGERA